jgi:putative endonuclease
MNINGSIFFSFTGVLMFVVYALYSKQHDKLYIGFTSNLEQRVLSHNVLSNKGYTVKYRPWKLIHQEGFLTKREAMRREQELKSHQGRNFLRSKIQ